MKGDFSSLSKKRKKPSIDDFIESQVLMEVMKRN